MPACHKSERQSAQRAEYSESVNVSRPDQCQTAVEANPNKEKPDPNELQL
jgi:hypothetical protein